MRLRIIYRDAFSIGGKQVHNYIRTTLTMPQMIPPASDDDYRKSHQQRGGTYDATLAASPFDAYMAQLERQYLREIVPSLFPHKKPRYLDFACGTGRITETVSPLCAEAIGVDISASMLAEARSKCPSVKFIETDLTKSKIDLGTFDLATSFRFFGNAQQDLRIAVLQALHRALGPKAYLIINSHRNPRSLAMLFNAVTGGGDQGMDLHFPKLKRLLHSCGFEIVQSRPIGFWMYRHKLMEFADAESPRDQRRESMFKSMIFTPFAPDAVVVARKLS